MSEANKDYELEILKMVINEYLDGSTSLTEASLNALETKRDQVVWDIATKIYSQSGYRVELSLVRDIVNSRIRIIKNRLTEESRRAAEQKVQQEAEEARRAAERKAQQEPERRKAQQEVEEAFRADESNPQFLAKRKAEIFIEVRRIISEQLAVNEAEVTLNSNPSNDLGADSFDLMTLLTALEEEFDIEISDEDFENHLGIVRNVVELIWENAPSFESD